MGSGEIAELRKFPPPAADAELLVVADGARCAVAYRLADGWKIGFFPVCEAFRLSGGTASSGCHEVVGSDWGRRGLRHLVFGAGGSTFECLVPRWNDEEAQGRAADVLARMHASLRHDDVPVLEIADETRGRTLRTWVYRAEAPDAPLVVFAHGWFGHPRKFKRLFRAWAEAGITVAAPALPLTNDESAFELDFDDVVNQPRDVSRVIDELAREGRPVGVGGFSLGGLTALAVAFNPRHRDPRVRAVLSIAGRFHDAFGAYEMAETPLLLVHGRHDQAVPYETGRAVYDAAREPKQLVTIEGEHDIPQDSSPHVDEVIAVTTAFWREHLLGAS